MSRYRKSIHQTLQEVSEWEAPKEPEVIVEEAPIPTETGRELLKKRIAHKKVGKREIKYYPMGDTFKNKLHKTTQHLKEALEIDDELDEAVKWEVKVTGLPVFYSDGKSKGAVRQMLRKLLKHPDDIISITRTTSAELKKIRRGQIAGDEPGDEDEDKNPVGPSYNEEVELDEAVSAKEYDSLKKGDTVTIDYKSAMSSGKATFKVTAKNVVGKARVGKVTLQSIKNPRGVKHFLYKRGNNVSFAQGDMGASVVKFTKEEDEMAIMSLDHEAPRKLKLTQQGLEAFKQSRDELDEAGRPRGAAHIENTRFWDLKDKELHYIIKDAGKAIQANPTAKKATQGPGNWSDQVNDAATVLYYRKNKKIKVEAFEGPFTAAGSGSIAKQRKAKAGDENKSIEQQMADARRGKLAFQEDEWDTMWKNAAKEKPKMSFKQAVEFVDEVGLEKKEKKNALKTAKKWLR